MARFVRLLFQESVTSQSCTIFNQSLVYICTHHLGYECHVILEIRLWCTYCEGFHLAFFDNQNRLFLN